MSRIDARGMSCPQPVLMVKKAVADNRNAVEVLVDNTTAENNVMRFLKSAGYKQVVCESAGDDTVIKGNK